MSSIMISCPICGLGSEFRFSDSVVQKLLEKEEAQLPCGHKVLPEDKPMRMEGSPVLIVIPVIASEN